MYRRALSKIDELREHNDGARWHVEVLEISEVSDWSGPDLGLSRGLVT